MDLFANGARRFLAPALFCLLALAYGRGLYLQHKQQERRNVRYGLYTAREVWERAQCVGGRLAILPARGELTASHYIITYNKRRLRIWGADYEIEQGKLTTRFMWRADTGELLSVFNALAISHSRSIRTARSLIDARTAVQRASLWLEYLECGPHQEWKLCGKLKYKAGLIAMTLTRGRQRIFVEISSTTGTFCYADTYAYPFE